MDFVSPTMNITLECFHHFRLLIKENVSVEENQPWDSFHVKFLWSQVNNFSVQVHSI
jgi:hypothetical protein